VFVISIDITVTGLALCFLLSCHSEAVDTVWYCEWHYCANHVLQSSTPSPANRSSSDSSSAGHLQAM